MSSGYFKVADGTVYDPIHGVNGERRDIWVIDLERKTERHLVPDFFTAGNGGVDWSADGSIYFHEAFLLCQMPVVLCNGSTTTTN